MRIEAGIRRFVTLLALALAAAGCSTGHDLPRAQPAFTFVSRRPDYEIVQCVQARWAARYATIATTATAKGARVTARARAFPYSLVAVADIAAFAPTRTLTVRALARRGHPYVRFARPCA